MGITTSLFENNTMINEFDFIFEKGEHTGEKYEAVINVICDNPTCGCARMDVTTYDLGKQVHQFGIDVKKKELDSKGVSIHDLNFGKAFIKELKDDDWKNFHIFFYSYKYQITKKLDIDKLKISFPQKGIEKGTMVAF